MGERIVAPTLGVGQRLFEASPDSLASLAHVRRSYVAVIKLQIAVSSVPSASVMFAFTAEPPR